MDRLLAACALTTVAGLLLLGGLAFAREPRPEPFDRLANLEGQRVCVEALLAHLRPTDAGAHLVLTQGNRSLAAFARFSPKAMPGDGVLACGPLDASSGTLRLRLERPGDLRVTLPYDAEATPLAALAREPWEYVDRHVLVHGVAEREGARWYLVDPTTRSRLPLTAAGLPEEEVPLRVEGLVEYDSDAGAFRLRVVEARPA